MQTDFPQGSKQCHGTVWGGIVDIRGLGLPKSLTLRRTSSLILAPDILDYYRTRFSVSRVSLVINLDVFQSPVRMSVSTSQFRKPQEVIQSMDGLVGELQRTAKSADSLSSKSFAPTSQAFWLRSVGQVALPKTAENTNRELKGEVGSNTVNLCMYVEGIISGKFPGYINWATASQLFG